MAALDGLLNGNNCKKNKTKYSDNTLVRGDYRKFPNQEKFVQSQTPSASMLPQIWNPRHMLGFEEFKVIFSSF